MKQEEGESLQDYYARFDAVRQLLEQHYGKLDLTNYAETLDNYVVADDPSQLTTAQKNTNTNLCKQAREQFIATVWLQGCDKTRCGKLMEDLNNQFILGNDQYPKDIPSAIQVVTNNQNHSVRNAVSDGTRRLREQVQQGTPRAAFSQTGRQGQQGQRRDQRICYNCQQPGHIAADCPRRTATSHAQAANPSDQSSAPPATVAATPSPAPDTNDNASTVSSVTQDQTQASGGRSRGGRRGA